MKTLAGMLLVAAAAWGQSLDNRSLNGRYFVRELFIASGAGGGISEARSLAGTLTFDGAGRFSLQGQQVVGVAPASTLTGNGTYTVRSNGFVTMTNPLQTGLTLNARLGSGILLGSTTDSGIAIFDLMIAVAAPATTITNASLSGAWWVASVEFPSALVTQARNTFFRLNVSAAGAFSDMSVSGQGANLGTRPVTQTVTGATYALTADGSGTATFPISAGVGATQALVAGTKSLYVSQDGNFLLMGSTAAGGHDFFVGVKALTTTVTNANWSGLYWGAGLRLEGTRPSSFAGSLNSTGQGVAVWSRRVRAVEGNADFSGVNRYTLAADGSGSAELNRVGVGAGGNGVVGSGVSLTDSNNYELYLAVRAPAISTSGTVFLHPHGAYNTAGFAPVGNPAAPGAYLSLFGSNLAPRTQTAVLPFPTTLAGVQVLVNDRPAPIYVASPTQMIALVPQATAPGTATLVVNNNGTRSNAVELPVAATAPGIFSLTQNGIGPGAIRKADFSVVDQTNPARRGDTVLVFVNGLGAVAPAVPDGSAAPANPLSLVNAAINVYIGGRRAQISFQGLAPGTASLYQLNVVIPADAPVGAAIPLAIETPEAFHDQVDIAIAP